MSRPARSRAGAALAAAGTTATALAAGRALVHPALARINHAGRPVSLSEGPAVVLGVLAGTTDCPGARRALLGAALSGAVDDHLPARRSRSRAPAEEPKGLTGHLGRLRRGEVTAGTAKLAGLVATGVLAGDDLAAVVLVAGCANLANLLDLRPGRALKAVALASAVLLLTDRRDSLPAVLLGASLAALPPDLRGRTMLGDTGANALGAVLGAGLAHRLTGRTRWLTVAGVTAATLLSEKVSFTDLIARTSALRALDGWGRSP